MLGRTGSIGVVWKGVDEVLKALLGEPGFLGAGKQIDEEAIDSSKECTSQRRY